MLTCMLTQFLYFLASTKSREISIIALQVCLLDSTPCAIFLPSFLPELAEPSPRAAIQKVLLPIVLKGLLRRSHVGSNMCK